MSIRILESAIDRARQGEPVALVTVVESSGSVPGKTGFRMLVTPTATDGTVGGGALEKEAIREARELLAGRGSARTVRIKVSDIDMQCGGEVVLLIEPLAAACPAWIFGGGHIAQALAPLAVAAGFGVTVVDHRPEFADPPRFGGRARTICGDYAEAARRIPAGAFVVIVTHGHSHDTEVLLEAARIEPRLPYIGMIGSRHKVAETRRRLAEAGVDPGPNLYTPVGLDLGGDTPGEIAVAIVSEMLGVRHGRTGLPHCRKRRT